MFLIDLLPSKFFLAAKIITLCFILINYAFKATGLYVLAKKNQPELKWMAFVPIANSYLLGKLAGPVNLFTTRIKNTALMLFLTHLIFFILDASFNILYYLPYIKDMIAGEYTAIYFLKHFSEVQDGAVIGGLNIIYVFLGFANFAYIILFITALMGLFRKYQPERYLWYALISVFFNVEGIFVFLIRNKEPINYEAYMKEKYARYQSQRGNFDPYNPYNRPPTGGGYGGYGGYGGEKPKSPFSEFEDSEVFPDFPQNQPEKSTDEQSHTKDEKSDD